MGVPPPPPLPPPPAIPAAAGAPPPRRWHGPCEARALCASRSLDPRTPFGRRTPMTRPRRRLFLAAAGLAALPLLGAAAPAAAQGTIRIGMTAADIPLTH